jgi:predicted DNA-binding transcriptional regulator AlpA
MLKPTTFLISLHPRRLESTRRDDMPARREITGRKPAATADVAKRKAGPPADDPDEIESDEIESDKREATSSSDVCEELEPPDHLDPDAEPTRKRPPVRGPPLAFSIEEFCHLHGFSRSFFYVLEQRGLAPRTMRLGTRVLISVEEAARWRAERTTAEIPTSVRDAERAPP